MYGFYAMPPAFYCENSLNFPLHSQAGIYSSYT